MAKNPSSWKSVAAAMKSLRAKRRKDRRRLMIEQLADRKLLAADVDLSIEQILLEDRGVERSHSASPINAVTPQQSIDVDGRAGIDQHNLVLIQDGVESQETDRPALSSEQIGESEGTEEEESSFSPSAGSGGSAGSGNVTVHQNHCRRGV